MLEKSSVREDIAYIAGPKEWGEGRERWLERVAKQVPTVSYRTVKALFYREIRNPDHWAARDIRRAVAERKLQEARLAAAAQLERAANGLRVTDEDFHSDTIAALVSAARALRGLDSA